MIELDTDFRVICPKVRTTRSATIFEICVTPFKVSSSIFSSMKNIFVFGSALGWNKEHFSFVGHSYGAFLTMLVKIDIKQYHSSLNSILQRKSCWIETKIVVEKFSVESRTSFRSEMTKHWDAESISALWLISAATWVRDSQIASFKKTERKFRFVWETILKMNF